MLRSPLLSSVHGLEHGFTTRALGSADDCAELLTRVLPDPSPWRVVAVKQVHGHAARDASRAGPEAPTGDAIVGWDRGDLLAIRTADCVAALLAVSHGGDLRAVAAIHAGWRGLLAGVVETTCSLLASPSDAVTLAALGPSIGPCCFEVGPEVASAFIERFEGRFVSPGMGDRSHVDLPSAVAEVLAGRGVRVEGSPPCTRCSPHEFHSFRAEGGRAGRAVAFIGMRP